MKTLEYATSMGKKIAPRLVRAALGFWLVLGPFIAFLIRWKWYEIVVIYVLLIGAFLFVGFMCWLTGPDYLRRLGSDAFTALASVLIGGGVSGIIGKVTHYSLHSSVLFLPLVILAGFILSESYRERRVGVPPVA